MCPKPQPLRYGADLYNLTRYLEANPIPGLLELIVDEGMTNNLFRVFPQPEDLSNVACIAPLRDVGSQGRR